MKQRTFENDITMRYIELDKYYNYLKTALELLKHCSKSGKLTLRSLKRVHDLLELCENGKNIKYYTVDELKLMSKTDIIVILDNIYTFYDDKYLLFKRNSDHHCTFEYQELKKTSLYTN